ncbi:MAG TPA: hypothetical protein VLF40_00730 [Candidatus Saccharimonadales bacterium]|nr:hypothetical protein [Candidatus Saccharimonadales bacterium]
MHAVSIIIFSLACIAAFYAADSLVAGQWLTVKARAAILYVLSMLAMGLVGEVAFDTAYNAAFGWPLWQYHLLPIHHSYTSVYSLVIWAAMGLHLYLLHEAFKKRGITSVHVLAVVFCMEALLLEALLNLAYQIFFGDYVFYYLPTDLWHVTSVQALPIYFFGGYIAVLATRLALRIPRRALVGNSLAIAAVLLLK